MQKLKKSLLGEAYLIDEVIKKSNIDGMIGCWDDGTKSSHSSHHSNTKYHFNNQGLQNGTIKAPKELDEDDMMCDVYCMTQPK